MNDTTNKANLFFWIIGILALLWNLMGVSAFVMQSSNSEAWRSTQTPEQLRIMDALPSWYMIVFGVAVIASAIACILLLMRRKYAEVVFLIALVAVLIQSGYNLFVNEAKASYTAGQYAMLAFIPIVSALLYWYAGRCRKKGWLK